MRCILGTLLPDEGSITVAGHPAGSVEARRAIGASLSQERSFYLRLSGEENLVLYGRLKGLSRRASQRAVDAIVEELELPAIVARRTDRCSTGQLQQLAVARALISEPEVLLLDEPTRSLDDAARGRVWAAIKRRPRVAVMIATHLGDDAAQATRVVNLVAPGGLQ
jgi:ABC-type multidrug transport system ATPase subunit